MTRLNIILFLLIGLVGCNSNLQLAEGQSTSTAIGADTNLNSQVLRCVELQKLLIQFINSELGNTREISRERRELSCDRPQIRLAIASGKLSDATPETRFYFLRDVAKASIQAGQIGEGHDIARELLELAVDYQDNWNYGNAIHDGNMVLGQAALSRGALEEAKAYLIKAGNTPGSPQLNTFGPNMSLANDLIQAGEIEIVVEYFELCREFWSSSRASDTIDRWIVLIRGGITPKFGANLIF